MSWFTRCRLTPSNCAISVTLTNSDATLGSVKPRLA
jgi:hypothetical protein